MKRENPTRCNNQMFIINFCLNMFRASLCPSSGEQRPCYCIWCILFWFCWMWLVAVVGRCVVGCERYEGFCSTPKPKVHQPCYNFIISARRIWTTYLHWWRNTNSLKSLLHIAIKRQVFVWNQRVLIGHLLFKKKLPMPYNAVTAVKLTWSTAW